MKKNVLLFVLILQGLILKANHNRVDLSLSIFDNSRFTLVFDETYFGNPCNQQLIANITPGIHHIQVMRIKQNPYAYSSFSEMIFRAYVDIPVASKVFAFIDHQGRFIIREIYPVLPQVNVYPSPPVVHLHGNQFNPYPFHPVQVCYSPIAMHPVEFEALLKVVQNKPFDSTKLVITKQSITSNNFSAAQVMRLMSLFSFESYKLEVAKLAYPKTIDQNNYYLVYEGFTFNSSIGNLAAYIGK